MEIKIDKSRKNSKLAFLSLVAFGILAMATTEFSVTMMEADLTIWVKLSIAATILFIGAGRAFIIIQTPTVRKFSPKHVKWYQDHPIQWMVGTTALISLYIFFLWWRIEAFTFDLLWLMQLANIVLVGAEWFFSKLLTNTKTPLHREVKKLKKKLVALQKKLVRTNLELEHTQSQMGANQLEWERKLDLTNSELDATQNELVRLNDKLVQTKLENGRNQLAANAIQSIIAQDHFTISGIHFQMCPDCFQLVSGGSATKSLICHNHEQPIVLWEKGVNS